ncbi:MAG: ATP-dependent protease subunit HslV [Candidatus Calescibacterium sp.]|nr:ATP-dependent protease subunit HslV [Candidatus Calescibacterium sp.]MDW8132855.1 ATP-dependent protease subunit HslV [Candidatus Calescibacterium sp.]
MTTILAVKRNNKLVIGGDGQVTLGNYSIKNTARKIRRMYRDSVLSGFAGGAADGLALYERLEKKLEEYNGNLKKAAVELARDWRTDKILRRLEAMIIVGNKETLLVLSGTGDIIEPDDNIAAIGSGGPYAYAAAKALYDNTNLDAYDIVIKSLSIASNICIYTNSNFSIDLIEF